MKANLAKKRLLYGKKEATNYKSAGSEAGALINNLLRQVSVAR
jgi:hypothetical protein